MDKIKKWRFAHKNELLKFARIAGKEAEAGDPRRMDLLKENQKFFGSLDDIVSQRIERLVKTAERGKGRGLALAIEEIYEWSLFDQFQRGLVNHFTSERIQKARSIMSMAINRMTHHEKVELALVRLKQVQ